MADILILDTSPITSMIVQYWFPDKKVEFKSLTDHLVNDIVPFIAHYKTRYPSSILLCFTDDPSIESLAKDADIDVCFKPLFDVDKFQAQLSAIIS